MGILYQHKNMGIMLRIATTDRHVSKSDGEGKPRERVWRSAKHQSMDIALHVDTAKGQGFVASSYLPIYTDVDRTPADPAKCPKRATVIAQHAELSRRAEGYTHAVVGMDANETTCTRGWIQTRSGDRTTYSGCNLSTMVGWWRRQWGPMLPKWWIDSAIFWAPALQIPTRARPAIDVDGPGKLGLDH